MSLAISNSRPIHAADSVLKIDEPRFEIDPAARRARDATEQFFKDKYRRQYPDPPAAAKDYINTTGGLSAVVAKVSIRLNSTGLDDTTRFLLASSEIYAYLVVDALRRERVKDDDEDAIYNSVMRAVGGLPKRYFLAKIVASALSSRRIQVTDSDKRWQRLDDITLSQGIPIRVGQVEPAITAILNTLDKQGDIPFYVEEYANLGIIDRAAFTPAIKEAMVSYLLQLGVQVRSLEEFRKGTYSDYFVLAYNEARKLSAATEDPIEKARIRGSEISWDFTVDTFESTEEQGVIPVNILAAGALDYIYYIGDRMHVFNVANALVLRWASGMLDIPDGKTATDLYRFHKKRTERSTADERAMMYKRVLNKGNGKLLSNMMPNKAFPGLWHALMSEAAEYIKKNEGSSTTGQISRSPLYQATKNLQYNLSEHMTGMAHRQVHEDYTHLQDALEILKSSEIVSYFGNRRKSLWNVVEQVAKEDLGMVISTSSLRNLAVEGNRVFQWIAYFNEGAIREEDFKAFLAAAEAWIIAQAAVESGDDDDDDDKPARNGKNGKKDDDDDDFDDW